MDCFVYNDSLVPGLPKQCYKIPIDKVTKTCPISKKWKSKM